MGALSKAMLGAGALVGSLAAIQAIDNRAAKAHRQQVDDPSFRWLQSPFGSAQGRANVFFPGLANDAKFETASIDAQLRITANGLLVCNPRNGYDTQAVVERTIQELLVEGRHKVVVIGSSFGAIAAIEFLRQVKRYKQIKVQAVILVCPVTCEADVTLPFLKLLPVLRGGPLMEWWFPKATSIVTRAMGAPEVGPDVDLDMLERQYTSMANFPVAAYIGQGRAIHQANPPRDGEFEDFRAFVFEYSDDPLVRAGTGAQVEQYFNAKSLYTERNGRQHADFVEFPGFWRKWFDETLIEAWRY